MRVGYNEQLFTSDQIEWFFCGWFLQKQKKAAKKKRDKKREVVFLEVLAGNAMHISVIEGPGRLKDRCRPLLAPSPAPPSSSLANAGRTSRPNSGAGPRTVAVRGGGGREMIGQTHF